MNILDAFYGNGPNDIKKHYVSHYSLLRLRAVGNHYFSIEKLHFEEVQKRKRQILINTVVYEDFRMHLAKK